MRIYLSNILFQIFLDRGFHRSIAMLIVNKESWIFGGTFINTFVSIVYKFPMFLVNFVIHDLSMAGYSINPRAVGKWCITNCRKYFYLVLFQFKSSLPQDTEDHDQNIDLSNGSVLLSYPVKASRAHQCPCH